jgi:SH3-like domain-containing protein
MKRTPVLLLAAAAVLLIVAAVVYFVLPSLLGGSGAQNGATAVLTAPAQQFQVTAGQAFRIEGEVKGSVVAKVQVLVNNQPIAVIDQADENGTFPLVIDYQIPPNAAGGSSVVQLKGFNAEDAMVVSSDPVFIQIAALTPPTATPAPEPTAAPTVPPPTPAADAPTAAPIPEAARIVNVENDKVNVRSGPGTGYELVGKVLKTEGAPVKGKSEDGTWWQIEYADAKAGMAWIFGELVQFTGDAAAVPIVKVAPPEAAPAEATAAPAATATPVPAPTTAPAALLPYSQADSFAPRNDIGDVPLGHNGEGNSSKWTWTINGAQRAEIEITAPTGVPDVYDCPQGNLAGVQPNSAAGKRVPVNLPTGEFPFTLTEKGYYVFTMYVTKADGGQTSIPRAVIFGCYKKPGR